jgi:hypothetical protein
MQDLKEAIFTQFFFLVVGGDSESPEKDSSREVVKGGQE